jgi:hypothetical protein
MIVESRSKCAKTRKQPCRQFGRHCSQPPSPYTDMFRRVVSPSTHRRWQGIAELYDSHGGRYWPRSPAPQLYSFTLLPTKYVQPILHNIQETHVFFCQLSIYPAPDREILLQETPSELEKQIGVARRAVTGVYNDAHGSVQTVISKWVGVEHAVERTPPPSSSHLTPN